MQCHPSMVTQSPTARLKTHRMDGGSRTVLRNPVKHPRSLPTVTPIDSSPAAAAPSPLTPSTQSVCSLSPIGVCRPFTETGCHSMNTWQTARRSQSIQQHGTGSHGPPHTESRHGGEREWTPHTHTQTDALTHTDRQRRGKNVLCLSV